MISTQCLSNKILKLYYTWLVILFIKILFFSRETLKNTNTDTSMKSLRSLIRTIGGLPTSPILGKQVNMKRISQPIPTATATATISTGD
jgi:hypothetical protein